MSTHCILYECVSIQFCYLAELHGHDNGEYSEGIPGWETGQQPPTSPHPTPPFFLKERMYRNSLVFYVSLWFTILALGQCFRRFGDAWYPQDTKVQ